MDYVVDSVLNNVNLGTATIVFVADNFNAAGISGTKTATFKILKGVDITNDEKLSVGIKDSTVPYAKGGARPQVTVRGLGNYGGLRTLTFKITGKKADWFGNTVRLLRDLREGR